MKRSIQLVALLLTVFMGSCTGGKDKAAAEHVDAKPIVKLADVKARPVDQIQDYTATVEAEVKNNIAPSSPVRIDQIFVEVGDRVSKGQKLVQMDAANLKQTKLQLDNQEIEFNRIDELYKVGGASKSEWDASKMQLDVKKTAYKNLLENTSLQSPINGVVTARNYDNGDMYSGGEPVLVVEQITPVKLLINVSETYFTKVKKGTPVDVKLDVYGDEVFTGTINLIYPTIDATTRTFQVEIRLDNKDQRVRPGMFARATLNFGTAENVVVPDLAIVKQAGSGDRVNGAARWMTFMGIQFQPSEIAKMAVVIVTAFILSKGQDEDGASPKAFKRIMIITCIVCGLILPENYSTGMLLFGTVYLMMFIGRVSARKLLILGGGIVAFVTVFVAFLLATPDKTLENIPMGHRFTTVKSRIADFTNKEEVPAAKFDIDGDGQVAHARIAVATSNVVGKGPGNSVQRDFLSQAFSDFIYAIIIEELGLVGGIVVVFLYVCLLVRVGRIAKKCDRTFPAFLITGIALLLVTQALFNMMVAVGLAPVTGQPLPLISKGGTSTFINCAYIGMILSVSRYTAKLEEQRMHDAQVPMLIDAGNAENPEQPADSEAQTAAEPTAKVLNSDAEFE